MSTANLKETSYTWQIDYQQIIHPNFAASIDYINEGHIINHHRDGTAFELWARLPFARGKFSVALGAGPYYFYDTQGLPNGDSLNVHGTALIVSASATGYFSNRWFYRAVINRIRPSNDITTNTAAFGIGFWFGHGSGPAEANLVNAEPDSTYVTDNELTVFGGQSVVNTLFSESAFAFGAEYRRGIGRHFDATASYIHEGHPQVIRRSGIAIQAWAVNTFFHQRVSVGIGLGPYLYADRNEPKPGVVHNSASAAPLASLTFAVRLSQSWHTRVVWNRVTSSYNRDADVFWFGLGYHWPR